LATATVIAIIQIRPKKIKSQPTIFKNTFTFSSNNNNCCPLVYCIQEHPECQHGGAAVDQVTEYGIFAPGFFFFTEHAR
jgi:hypothetical protein